MNVEILYKTYLTCTSERFSSASHSSVLHVYCNVFNGSWVWRRQGYSCKRI